MGGLFDTDTGVQVVTVKVSDGKWRVCAAHMEPLLFGGAPAAEEAGRRVAESLAQQGFDACLVVHGEAGALASTTAYTARNGLGLRVPPRRRLHS